jgi:hypothetical protein
MRRALCLRGPLYILLTVGAVLAAGMLAARAAGAADGPQLRVEGGTGTASVTLDGLAQGQAVNGFDITLAFDATAVQLTSVDAADGWDTSLIAPTIDNAAGTVRVVGVAPGTACTTTCTLFSLTFTAANGSGSALTPTAAKLATPDGRRVASTVSAGYVTVTPFDRAFSARTLQLATDGLP